MSEGINQQPAKTNKMSLRSRVIAGAIGAVALSLAGFFYDHERSHAKEFAKEVELYNIKYSQDVRGSAYKAELLESEIRGFYSERGSSIPNENVERYVETVRSYIDLMADERVTAARVERPDVFGVSDLPEFLGMGLFGLVSIGAGMVALRGRWD